MRVAVARVRFSRQASDGDYGSETISIERELVAENDEDLSVEVINAHLHACRLDVEAELRTSPNWKVQRAVRYAELEPDLELPYIEDER